MYLPPTSLHGGNIGLKTVNLTFSFVHPGYPSTTSTYYIFRPFDLSPLSLPATNESAQAPGFQRTVSNQSA
jgi:hypothetical protein